MPPPASSPAPRPTPPTAAAPSPSPSPIFTASPSARASTLRSATPAAGDPLTYSAVLPAGLSINAGTGVISGTPADAAYGSNPVTVTATDAHGKAVSESFTFVVGDTGPTGTPIANQSGNEGQAFSLDVCGH